MERELIAEFIDIAPRLLAATAAGIVIGVNRDMRGKGAGIRTLGLVALGSALAVVSVARFSPPALSGVLQGIITGVGFIGGGSILRGAKADEVPGLTTAATVWVTASIGIACGLGYWLPVFLGVAIFLILLVVAFPSNTACARGWSPFSTDGYVLVVRAAKSGMLCAGANWFGSSAEESVPH